MLSAGCGIGYKMTQSRSGVFNFLGFPRVIGRELTSWRILWGYNHLYFCAWFWHFLSNSQVRVLLFEGVASQILLALLLVAAFSRNDLPFIFLTSVVTVLCLFCPLPSPKASDSSNLSLCLGESYFLFFLLEVGISHCVALPPPPNNHHPTWGKRFPCLMFQTALPSPLWSTPNPPPASGHLLCSPKWACVGSKSGWKQSSSFFLFSLFICLESWTYLLISIVLFTTHLLCPCILLVAYYIVIFPHLNHLFFFFIKKNG